MGWPGEVGGCGLSERQPLVTLLINPSSGHGKAGKKARWIVDQLRQGLPNVAFKVYVTRSFADAISKARDTTKRALEKDHPELDSFVVVGGDGMSHLGFNVCCNAGMSLGIIPAGTGNDFLRGIGIKPNMMKAIGTIIEGTTRKLDLLRVDGPSVIKRVNGATFVGSVISTGFDARVNLATNRSRINLGPLSYALSLFTEARRFKPSKYRIKIDGKPIEQEAMICAVGNAGVIGGGIKICPDAKPDDGLIDITLVDPVPFSTLVRYAPSLYSGTFVKQPFVHRFQAKEVEIDGDDLIGMADGEELGGVPMTATIAPQVLNLYAPVGIDSQPV